jgi:hypothetical protein
MSQTIWSIKPSTNDINHPMGILSKKLPFFAPFMVGVGSKSQEYELFTGAT